MDTKSDVRQTIEGARDVISVQRVFGDPYEKNGVTVIPAARVQGGAGGGGGDGPGGEGTGIGAGFGVNARPAGAFVIRGEEVDWRPAIDVNRVILGGQLIAIAALLLAAFELAPLLIAISGPNGEYPRRVSATGGLYIEKDGRDIPDTFLLTADYPSEWSLFLVSTLTNDAGLPDKIYGKYGTMELGGEPLLRWNGDFKEEFKAKNEGKEEARLPIRQRRDLEGNFIDVLRGKDKLACNSDLGCATMVTIKMAVESFRQGKTLFWDEKKEQVTSQA